MKKVIAIAFVLLLLIPASAFAVSESPKPLDDDILEELHHEFGKYDFSSWEAHVNNDLFSNFSVKDMIDSFLSGNPDLAADNMLDKLSGILKITMKQSAGFMFAMLAISLVTGLCNAMIPDEKSSLREVAGFILSAMSLGLVIAIFSSAVNIAAKNIQAVSAFAEAAMPVTSVLLIASGANMTSGVVSPLMTILSTTVVGIIKTVIFPLILIGCVLSVVSSISPKSQLKQLLSLVKNLTKWSIGILATIYTGLIVLKGLAAANYDGLSIKTTKYLIDKTVPVAGGFFSGTIDTTLVCAQMVKSAAGLVAIVAVIIIISKTLLSIFCTNMTFRLTAAMCEPISDERIPKLLTGVADMMSFLFAAVMVCGLMFIILFGIVVTCV